MSAAYAAKQGDRVEKTIGLHDVDAHVLEFMANLEYARSIYFPQDPDCGRFAAKAGLAACIHFALRTVPNGIDLVMPLRELLDALSDLDNLVKSPMLTIKMKHGGRPSSRGTETFRSMAAVLMEIYIWNGASEVPASKDVAKKLNDCGYFDERGQLIASERVRDWRNKVMENGDDLGAKRYRAMCAALRPCSYERAEELVLESLLLIPKMRIPSGVGSNGKRV